MEIVKEEEYCVDCGEVIADGGCDVADGVICDNCFEAMCDA